MRMAYSAQGTPQSFVLFTLSTLLLSKAENLTPKKRVNRDKPDFATKQRMFGLLTIDEGPPLSMTAGPAVPQLLLVCG